MEGEFKGTSGSKGQSRGLVDGGAIKGTSGWKGQTGLGSWNIRRGTNQGVYRKKI